MPRVGQFLQWPIREVFVSWSVALQAFCRTGDSRESGHRNVEGIPSCCWWQLWYVPGCATVQQLNRLIPRS